MTRRAAGVSILPTVGRLPGAYTDPDAHIGSADGAPNHQPGWD